MSGITYYVIFGGLLEIEKIAIVQKGNYEKFVRVDLAVPLPIYSLSLSQRPTSSFHFRCSKTLSTSTALLMRSSGAMLHETGGV